MSDDSGVVTEPVLFQLVSQLADDIFGSCSFLLNSLADREVHKHRYRYKNVLVCIGPSLFRNGVLPYARRYTRRSYSIWIDANSGYLAF